MLDEVAWMGLWLKPDVPADVQARIRQATLKVMSQPAVRARLAELGNDVGSGATPEDLAKSLRTDSDKQGATLRALGHQPAGPGRLSGTRYDARATGRAWIQPTSLRQHRTGRRGATRCGPAAGPSPRR